jgi:UDP-glucose 4-epimerase
VFSGHKETTTGEFLMDILMTGGTGLIGSAVRSQILSEGHVVHLMGRNNDFNYKVDLNMFSPPDLDVPYDVFMHCAGITDEEILDDKEKAVQRATVETIRLLDWAASLGLKRIAYISTAHVYGDLNRAINESTRTEPLSLYGMLHLFCEQYLKRLGVPYSVLRPLAVFGDPGQDFRRWGLVPFSFPKALAERDRIVINTHGKQYRNFVSTQTIAGIISEDIQQQQSRAINAIGYHNMSIRGFAEFCVHTLQPFSEDEFGVVVKEDAAYTNRFDFKSNILCCEENPSLLTQHVIHLYQLSKRLTVQGS